MGELCRNKGCTKVHETVYSWIIFIKGHVSIGASLLSDPNKCPTPISTREVVLSNEPLVFSSSIDYVFFSIRFFPLPVKNFRCVWGASRP